MSVFIVGGDYLGNIPAKLKGFGFTEIMHLSGRKKGHVAVEIPSQVDVVLVLTNYVNHGCAVKIKEKARKMGAKTLFARRAWSHISEMLVRELG
ncbi:DUF2325 domain-containing protein [Syntrophaceticus schinkii]|uniref:Diverged CheY-domain n=1 Tax=Syntrophaceticus schinkii TaxID=499207 RepID=A0A0B7MPG6_9FIRM|nr:DUF2325 domain-containing protein [Syntrophaceticus schinkii]MDD4262270.1 DUF2325 domain-containing protein [Syntrophaceticus schinkii]MDD4675526.1 DUF2325 domain-containing protein [Syntrophaceticus schinkii]CEO90118.1 Diverged CheY-domain [Syntrophaceticus schinkii]